MNNTDFTPKLVATDKVKINQLKQLYENIIYTSEILKSELDFIFKSPTIIKIPFFLEFFEASDPVKHIRQKWVLFKNINIDGVDMEVFTASNLLKIPKYEEAIQLQRELKELYSQARVMGFYYPIEKLFNKNDNCFGITQDFTDKLTMNFSSYTASNEQNEQLEAFQELRDSINKLCNMGIIKASGGFRIFPERLYGNILKNNHSDKNPFELTKSMFQWRHLAKGPTPTQEQNDSDHEENDSDQEFTPVSINIQ